LYADGNNVFFDDTLVANPVVSGGTVSPSTVSFNNNSANYTIAASIGGSGTTFTKSGTATTVLTGANTYGSNTLANAGTLIITNGGVIYSPAAALNVGSGSARGTVTLADGGAITVQQLLATNVVCATLITGVIYSERTDLQPVALIPGAEASISGPMDSPMEIANAMAENRTALINPAAGLEGSLSNSLSALPTDGPLFDLRADPASLTIPGRN
ncbi:MAG: hypothetical protein WCK27_32270, partial [Verrucomicrobiota bacterium]